MIELEVNNLTKLYDKRKLALDSINFSVKLNGIFAIIGRNGAGKTTFLRILATQLLPTSGTVLVDGVDIIKEPGKIRERMAAVPQEARPVNWMTPQEMIFSYLLWRGYGYDEAKIKTSESLATLEITEFAKKPNRTLSGGTKRKVLVATAISTEADIIFLDEPTTGLDPISRQQIWSLLKRIKENRLIFLTTHYLEEAEELADMIGILDRGKLMGLGTLKDFRSKVDFDTVVKIYKKIKLPPGLQGNIIYEEDGIHVNTNSRFAAELSESLLKEGVPFSVSPLTLQDIFFNVVHKNEEE
jgi:ABC-2 type transport system ATP-binding protein